MIDFENELKIALKTGKVELGSRSALRLAKTGKAKLIVIASDAPEAMSKDVNYYAKLSGTATYTYPGTAWNLAGACEKPHIVAVLSVLEPGDSEVLRVTEAT